MKLTSNLFSSLTRFSAMVAAIYALVTPIAHAQEPWCIYGKNIDTISIKLQKTSHRLIDGINRTTGLFSVVNHGTATVVFRGYERDQLLYLAPPAEWTQWLKSDGTWIPPQVIPGEFDPMNYRTEVKPGQKEYFYADISSFYGKEPITAARIIIIDDPFGTCLDSETFPFTNPKP